MVFQKHFQCEVNLRDMIMITRGVSETFSLPASTMPSSHTTDSVSHSSVTKQLFYTTLSLSHATLLHTALSRKRTHTHTHAQTLTNCQANNVTQKSLAHLLFHILHNMHELCNTDLSSHHVLSPSVFHRFLLLPGFFHRIFHTCFVLIGTK